MVLIWILVSTLVISAVSLIGILSLAINEKLMNKVLFLMIGFAAGTLIGAAFLHLLPESVELCSGKLVFLYTLFGFSFFFIMERYFYWRHCHNGVCDVHAFTYLNLIGDGIHNFADGVIVSIAFTTDIKLGMVTTLAIIFHEIPQELSDFAILVYGGFSKSKALLFNFLCALTAVLGAMIGYIMTGFVSNLSVFLIPFSAGGFIYIAASDLLPELHREKDVKKSNLSLITFLFGILFMWLTGFLHE